MERNWKMLHSGSVTDKKGYRWLYTIQDDDTCEVIGCGLEEADAKIISQAPETLRQRDDLIKMLEEVTTTCVLQGTHLKHRIDDLLESVEGSG